MEFNKFVKDLKKTLPDAMTLTCDSVAAAVKLWLSTGVWAIDRIIGEGIPAGRLTEIYGDFSSGKTLLAMQLVRESQKKGYISIVLDTEASFSLDLARKIGLDLDKVVYLAPQTIEEVFEDIEKIIEMKKEKYAEIPMLIVWDSVAATPCQYEIDNPVGTPEMGLRARIISQGLRKIITQISKEHIFLFFVNQIRESMEAFGDKHFTPGGKAIKFHASVRLFIKSGKDIVEGNDRVIGKFGSIKVTKNKIYPPFRSVDFEIYFDKGIPQYSGVLDVLVEEGKINKKDGGWYEYKGVNFRADQIEEIIKKAPDLLK